MILYSVDEPSTFENAFAMRKKIERAKDVESFPMVLVASKCDVAKREISVQQGEDRAKEFGCPFMETSAKAGVGHCCDGVVDTHKVDHLISFSARSCLPADKRERGVRFTGAGGPKGASWGS